MRADRLSPRGMFIVPHSAPEGYERFVALVAIQLKQGNYAQ